MTRLANGTVLYDNDAVVHMRSQGKFIWSVFENEVVSTFRGTTKREWLDRWDRFIGDKIVQGWDCGLVGVNPYWRGKVAKLAATT